MTENYIPTCINLPTGLEVLYSENDHRAECPTCRQQTLLRRKRLSKVSVRALWLMRSRGKVTAQEIRDRLGAVSYTTYTELKYWDLIKKQDDGWTITWVGNRFLEGTLSLPDTLWVYNDHPRIVPENMHGQMVTFRDLVPEIEMNREIAASESKKIDVHTSQTLPV